jgi:trehalose synthase
LREVEVQALDAVRLGPLIGPERMARFDAVAESTRLALGGRTVINVSSTATGGGVAEMLQTLLAYVLGAGIQARWLVIRGDPVFFGVTKRIHNGLYGSPGDGGPLGPAERRVYERVQRANAIEFLALVRPGASSSSTIRSLPVLPRLCATPEPSWSGVAMSAATSRISGQSDRGASSVPISSR